MFCRKCGLKNDDDAVFCKLCGARLSEEEVEQFSEGTLSLSSTPPVPKESVVGNKTVATKEAKSLKPKKKLHLHFFYLPSSGVSYREQWNLDISTIL